MRFEDPTPDAARELAAVEAALAGEAVPPDLDELAELTHALRADRPVPSTSFALELDALAGSGFRTPRTAPSGAPHGAPAATPRVAVRDGGDRAAPLPSWRRRVLLPRRRLSLALGTAAAVFIVATAVLSSGVLTESGEDAGRPSPAAPGEPVPGERAAPGTSELQGSEQAPRSPGARSAPGAPAGDTTVAPSPPVPRPRGIAPHVRDRIVERQATLTLAAPPDEVENVADDVISITDRYRGFVLSSTVSGGEAARAGATLDLRIPSARLQPALADLSELAHVRARTQSAEDVTAGVVSLRERLAGRLAQRRALLRQLGRAATDSEVESVRARLRIVNSRIARSRAALERQRGRVDFAAVSVAVEADRSAGTGGGGWTAGDALEDALAIFEVSLGVLLVSVAVLLPTSLLVLAGLLVGRRVRRERRERALDQSAGFANPPSR